MKCPKCLSENQQTGRFCAVCGAPLTRIPSQDAPPETATFIPPPEELQAGTMFAGRYRVIEEVGGGSMGKVYKVFDTKIQEKIALKIIRPEISGREKTILRFRNELKLARQITHKNICRVYDLGEEPGTLFITMELVQGEDLKRKIRSLGPLSVEAAKDYARQICEGLAEAHRRGVIHRDLKPQNIMIDLSGTVKIMDFGIARSLETKDLTAEGMMIGTPEYISPEQAEGKTADPRSDIYALGVILYEMATGRLPFAGDTPFAVALKHKSEIPVPPREINAHVPDDLNRVILRCLEKDRAARFQNAEELLAELNRLELPAAKTGPPVPGKTSAPEKFRFLRLRFVRAAGILSALAIILGGGYLLLRRSSPGKNGGTEPPAETPRKIFLAVLPLKDLSREKNQEIFCEGLTEDIRTKLSGIVDLKVISKNSSDLFKDASKDLKEIGRTLRVQQILTGDVHAEKEARWVNISLNDVQSGAIRRFDRYNLTPETYFSTADKIVDDVSQALKVGLTETASQNIKKREPPNPDAYKFFRLGQHFEVQYRESGREEDFTAALQNYQKAGKAEPGYALAFWGMGNLYEARLVKNDRPQNLVEMQTYYQQALDADPNLAEAHLGLGWTHFHKGEFDQALPYFKKAVEINPNDVEVGGKTGSFLRSIGLYEKAVKYFSKCIEFDPLNPSHYFNLASCHWHLGNYEKAASICREALVFDPENSRMHLNLARQLLMLKKYDDAEKEISSAEKIQPLSQPLLRHQAWLCAAKGDKEKALALIKNVERPFLYEITNAYCLLDMKTEAIQNIYDGINKGFHIIKEEMYTFPHLDHNPIFELLRGDPRFKTIFESEKNKQKDKMRKYAEL